MQLRLRRILFVLLCGAAFLSAKSQAQPTLIPIAGNCNTSPGFSLIVPSYTNPTPYHLIWGTPGSCPNPTLSSVPGPGSYTTVLTNSCGAGYSILIFDDNSVLIGSTNSTGAPTYTTPTSLNPVGSPVEPQCFGDCNGSRNVVFSGVGPLTVTFFPAAGTPSVFNNIPTGFVQTFSNLCAGTHSFHAIDANNCTYTTSNLSFTLGQPSILGANLYTNNPTCNGLSNGVFSITPTGGTPGYTVIFSNNSTVTLGAGQSATVGNIFSGTFSATVIDSRNCTYTVSANYTQPTLINFVTTQTNVSCGGQCTGQANVNVTGGGGGYTYTWSPGPGNTPSLSALCAGAHTLSITDAYGCERSTVVTITQPASISITPTITNITCHGDCTGAASITASGPPGPITFTWLAPPAGTVAGNSSFINNRCAGVYTLLASTSPTCVNDFTLSITQPTPIVLSALTTSVNCINMCNGSATANISGGNGAPYSFTWTPASAPPPVQTGPTASNLCPQNYTLSARDASNCPASLTFSITQPPPFSFGITTTSVFCNGACTGAINASPSGGTAPYSYTLASASSTVSSGSPVFTNLCAGNYTLMVSDNSGACAQQTTVNIAQPNPLVPSVNITSLTCANVCDGQLAGSAAGGTPGYTLFWNTPTGTVSGGVLTDLCAGNYTFNIRDNNNCLSTPTIISLTSPSPMTVNINVTDATCFGNCNGILSGNVSGGTPGYTLNWSTGFTGNPLTNRCTGEYTLTVTDANSCTTAATASVSAPPPIVLSQTTSPTSCAGSCDGSATITASGGVGSYTYQFNTVPVVSNTSGILTNRCAGNYIASVTDANSCVQSINFNISSPAALSAAITGTRNSCTTCTGGATVTPSNGTPPYTGFVWTNSVNATVGTGSMVNALCPGNYTVSVADSKSCQATATVSISQIVIVTVVHGGTGIQCFGACTGSAVASATGGQPPYNFSWSPGAQTSATATGLCAGTYTVYATDSNSPACSNSATITINQPPDMVITSQTTGVSCSNLCDGAISLSVTGGTGPKSYLWSPGGMTTSSVSGLCAGVYSVTVTDANGCSKPTLTFNIAPPFPAVTATLNATNPTNCNNPNTGSITAVAAGGNGTYSYSWVPVGSTGATLNNVPAGSYSVLVTSSGCTYTFFTTLTNPAGPSLTALSQQSVSCYNGNNGAASFSASGVGPFTFTWTPSLTQNTTASTTSVSGLTSGTYVVASTDVGNNCVTTQTIFIPQASSVTANGTVTNIQCSGPPGCDGAIAVAPTGGAPPYSYTWSPGGAISSSITNQCAGTYSLDLRDNNNCLTSYTFNIVTPSSITVSSTVTNVRCNGACDGSVAVNATGGTGAISYSWLPQAGFSGSTTATVLNLCPAVYTLQARDANNCVTLHTVQVSEPPALTSTLDVQQINCASSCDGSATLTAVGGTPTYSFTWSSGSATTSTLGNLCAGNYTGYVTDGNGCISSQSFTIASPSVFSLSLVPSHPLCNAACNGSIQTTVSGAQGPVTFVWMPAGSGQNPAGLCPGSYTVDATDDHGCQASAVITLTNPPALLANVAAMNTSCNGLCDGVALSVPVNAQGAVSYSWYPSGPNSALNTGLCAGTYSMSIADANGCTFSQTFQVSEPPLLTVNVSIGPASCGASNGSITASPVGGTPNYTFAWTSPAPPPIATTGSVVNNLPAGVYTVAVVDGNGCTNTVSIPLSNSNGPIAPITSTNVLCNGECTGAASVGVISGGTPPYQTPAWVVPAPTVSAAAIFSLCAQGYTLQLTDALNCLTYTGITISEPPPVNIVPTVSLPLCRGVCDGTVSLLTSGGVAPYTYTWLPSNNNNPVLTNACAGDYVVMVGYNSGSCVTQQTVSVTPMSSISIAPPLIENNRCYGDCQGTATVNVLSSPGGGPLLSWNNGQTGPVAAALCNGIYSVTITDTQGCSDTFSVPIISPSQLSVNPSVTQPDCGLCNGSATVTGSGGSGTTYSFSWTNGSTLPNATGLCAGLYQVLVSDSLNCSQSVNIIINSSNGITGENVSKSDESCALACDGSATVTAVGGTSPVTYNWLNTPVANTSTVAAGLCADVYFVEMTDARGCERTASVEIVPAEDFTVSTFVDPPGCNLSDGTIRLLVTGGSGNYSYNWQPGGASSGTVTGLGAGSYTVTITDQGGAGCSKTVILSLPNLNAPVFAAMQTNIACSGLCTGAIVLTTTQSPVPTYSWSNGTQSDAVSGLCEGIITVTATASGCSSVRSFTIGSARQLFADSDVRDVLCFGECNGQIALMATGGTLPYTFSWTPGQSNAINVADSLCAGTYSAEVMDANGCMISLTGTVSEAPLIVITSTVQNSTCSSVPDGDLFVDVSGGAPSYSFSWSGPSSFTANTKDLTDVLAGSYTLNLIDSAGCSRDTVLTVIPSVTLVADAGVDFSVCPGAEVIVDGSLSQGAFSYNWIEIPAESSVTASPSFTIASAMQTRTFVLNIAAINPACTDNDTLVVNVFEQPYLDAGPSYTIPLFSTVQIGGNPTTEGVLSHTWMPALYLSDAFAQNPVASNTIDVTYTVTMMYGDGCMVSDTMRVFLYPEIKIHSAFTPNDDGKNDTWIIDYIEQFPDNTVEIYNRWGERLFFSHGYAQPFDGTYNGSKLPVGTYYYVIILNHPSYPKPYTGPVTIFR